MCVYILDNSSSSGVSFAKFLPVCGSSCPALDTRILGWQSGIRPVISGKNLIRRSVGMLSCQPCRAPGACLMWCYLFYTRSSAALPAHLLLWVCSLASVWSVSRRLRRGWLERAQHGRAGTRQYETGSVMVPSVVNRWWRSRPVFEGGRACVEWGVCKTNHCCPWR